MYLNAIEKAKEEGGNVLVEGGVLEGEGYESGCYVKPVIIEAKNHFEIVQGNLCPILYVMKYSILEEAIDMQNGVKQGLSSSIMTNNLREAEMFLSAAGSDCGIANVNISLRAGNRRRLWRRKRNWRRKRKWVRCIKYI